MTIDCLDCTDGCSLYFFARIAGLTTTLCLEPFPCLWLLFNHFKSCEYQADVFFYELLVFPSVSFVVNFTTRIWYQTSCHVLYSDLSNNRLTGAVPVNGSFSLFTPIRFVTSNIFPNLLDLATWLDVCWPSDFHFSVFLIIIWKLLRLLHHLLFHHLPLLLLQVCYIYVMLIVISIP